MKQALIFAFAVVPAVAGADCNSESVIFRSALESRGYVVEAFGEVAEIDGTCGVQGIAFAEENLAVEIAELSWQLKGLEALTSGTGVLSFEATLTDLRMSPRTPDRWVSYMLSEQNRRNTIDATFNLTWDLATGQLAINNLDVDLPGDNRVVYDLHIAGATPALLTGDPAALQAVSLNHMALTIVNHGFADSLILGPLIARLSEVPGAPETVIEGTKRDFRALVSNLPGDVFERDTKSALIDLIAAAPVPWGELSIRIVPNPTISLAPFFDAALQPITPDSISTLFQGGRVEVTYIEDSSEN